MEKFSMHAYDACDAINGVVNPEFFAGARVVVLGATGFIGSVLVYALHKLGASVVACGRNVPKLEELYHDLQNVSSCELDVTKPIDSKLEQYGSIDVIINAASSADPRSFAQDPIATFMANIEGIRNVCQFAARYKQCADMQNDQSCKIPATNSSPESHEDMDDRNLKDIQILYISSGEVYGYFHEEHLVTEVEQGYLAINDSRSCYPQAKRAAETLCASYASQYGVDIRIVRPSHVFGPQFTHNDSRVSAEFFRLAMRNEDIRVNSPQVLNRTYVYISDAVAAILSVISSGASGQVYNVTNSDNSISVQDFARRIAHYGHVQAHVPAEVDVILDSGVPRYKIAQLDDRKLRGLGWAPAISIDEGIARTYFALEHK